MAAHRGLLSCHSLSVMPATRLSTRHTALPLSGPRMFQRRHGALSSRDAATKPLQTALQLCLHRALVLPRDRLANGHLRATELQSTCRRTVRRRAALRANQVEPGWQRHRQYRAPTLTSAAAQKSRRQPRTALALNLGPREGGVHCNIGIQFGFAMAKGATVVHGAFGPLQSVAQTAATVRLMVLRAKRSSLRNPEHWHE